MPRQSRKIKRFLGGKNPHLIDYEDEIRSQRKPIEINVPLEQIKTNNVITSYKTKQPKIKNVKRATREKSYKGGSIPVAFENIDITPFLITAWQQIDVHAGFETTTLSIFNPSFVKLFDIGGVETYICTCRVIYHYEDNAENADRIRRGMPPRPLNDAERGRAYDRLNGQYIIGNQGPAGSKRNDEHHYIIHPGSALAAPWYNPSGCWGGTYMDNTMVCVLRLTNTRIDNVECFIPGYSGHCPIDARIFSVDRQIVGNLARLTLFITGSSVTRRNKDIQLGNIDNTIDPASQDGQFNGNWEDPASGWKHGLLRLKFYFNMDGTLRNTEHIDNRLGPAGGFRFWRNNGRFVEETLADCTSWHGRVEKNYAMYYDSQRGRMALNFHLNWGPSPGFDRKTMVFYTKDYNGTDTDFETYDDQTWTVHRPPNSDIFSRIDDHYGNLNYMHWTCTTPFLLYNGELHAAGHMKISYQKYLDQRLNEWIATGPADPDNWDSFEQYFAGGDRPRDHLLHSIIEIVDRVIREQTQNPAHGVGSENAEYVRRILMPTNGGYRANRQKVPYALLDNTVDVNDRNAPQTMIRDASTWRSVFKYLVDKGFYVLNGDVIDSPKNIHFDYVYYMFFYSVDPGDFHLLHFSDPFMIEHKISAYLDFPVGLTQLEGDMLLSYGHGDCYSYLAKFPQNVYNGFLTHTNATDPGEIQYNIFTPREQNSYIPPGFGAPGVFDAANATAVATPGIPAAPAGFGFGPPGLATRPLAQPTAPAGLGYRPFGAPDPTTPAYVPGPGRPFGAPDPTTPAYVPGPAYGQVTRHYTQENPFGWTPAERARMEGKPWFGGSKRKRNAKRKTHRIR